MGEHRHRHRPNQSHGRLRSVRKDIAQRVSQIDVRDPHDAVLLLQDDGALFQILKLSSFASKIAFEVLSFLYGILTAPRESA